MQTNFDRAAVTYLQHAEIQVSPALELIERIHKYYHPNDYILDLGSGPGTLAHTQDTSYSVINFDLSLAMLKTSDNKFKICGDAHKLPFANNSFNLIISNLMMQWSSHKSSLLSEIYRVLKPNGKLIFTTLIKPSLFELQQAWRSVDNYEHTINLLDANSYYHELIKSGFTLSESKTWSDTIYFSNLSSLMQHFKSTGTTMPKANCSKGLGGRQKLVNLELSYKKFYNSQGIPLTYVYLLIIVSKDTL